MISERTFIWKRINMDTMDFIGLCCTAAALFVLMLH